MRILKELGEFEILERLNLQADSESRTHFLYNFYWADSKIQPNGKQAV